MIKVEMLIQRCLVHGVKIYPYQLFTVLHSYESKKIPDKVLVEMSCERLALYVKGLYLCGQEEASEWTEGHKILKSLGFKEKVRVSGHRRFVSLVYK